MANNIIKRIWNQNTLVNIEALRGAFFQDEDGGHTFEISGVDNSGNAISLSGTVAGVFLRPDNTDVPINGSASGGIVSVTLPAECYDVPGRFGLTVFVTSDGQKTCVYAAIGTVGRTSSGSVAPGTSADVVDLINQISAAVATIPASWSGLMADIAPTYSTSAAYPVGAYVYYNGDLYRCTTAITTGETWTAAHWTTAVLGNDVSDLKTAINLTGLTWEQGTYSQGQPASSSKRIRTVGAFKVAYPFTVKAISGYGYNVFYGTTEDTPYQYYNEWQTVDHTYFDTSLYYRITASHNDQSNIYPTEKPIDLVVSWDYYSRMSEDVDRIVFNLQWEQGNINSSGANVNANNRIRTGGSFQPVCPFIVAASEGYGFNVYVSEIGGTPVPLYTAWQSGPIIYTDINKIYRISVRKNDNSNFTPINNAVSLEWAYQNEIGAINNGLIPLCVEDDNYFIWERGTINAQGGDDSSTTRIRTKGTYGFTTLFHVSCDTGYGYNVFISNVGGTPLPLFNAWQTGTMTFPVDATKIYRFSFAKLNSSTIVVADSVHFHLKRLDSNLFAKADNPIMPYGAWFRTYSHSIETTKAPKNTLSACKSAYNIGYRWLESDIHMTSDNVPVMCHNATINATSDYTGDKTIAEMTYDELLEYDFGSWFSSDFAGEKILTLDTLCKFAYTHDCGLSLECKKDYSWTAETILIVYNIVKKNNMLGRVIWNNAGVSTPMTLMKALDPNQDFAFFYENAIPSSFDAITAFKTASNRVEVCDYLSSWTQEKVDAAKAAGLICLAHHVTYGITENLTLAEYKTIIDMGFEATLVQGINTTKWASEMFE